MGYVSSSRSIGSGANTCFVGVQTALDALHYSGARKAAEDCLKVKCSGENLAEYHGDVAEVQHDDHDSHQNVDNAHHRNHNAGNLNHALAAAQNADANQNSQNQTANHGNDGGFGVAVEAVAGEAGDQVVGAQHIEANGVGSNQRNSEHNAQHTAVQCSFDVVSGAAVAAAVFVTLLVNLCQSGFDERGSAANQSDDPHPEHSTVAADGDSICNANDVAGTHAACGGNHQCLEGGNGVFVALLFGDDTDGFAQQSQLHELGTEGEVQTNANQHNDQHVAVHNVADIAYQTCKPI